MNQTVSITHEVGRHLAVTTFEWHHEELGDQMAAAFGPVARYLTEHGIAITGPAVGFYRRIDGGVFRASAGFVVDGQVAGDGVVEPLLLPPGDTLTTLHIGPYERLTETYAALQDHAAARELVLDQDVMWEEYYSDHAAPAEQTRTRVYWPIVSQHARSEAMA